MSLLIRWATRAIAKPQENGSQPAVKPATGGRISYALAHVSRAFLPAHPLMWGVGMIPTPIPTGTPTPDRVAADRRTAVRKVRTNICFTFFDDFDNRDSAFPNNELVERATTENANYPAGML